MLRVRQRPDLELDFDGAHGQFVVEVLPPVCGDALAVRDGLPPGLNLSQYAGRIVRGDVQRVFGRLEYGCFAAPSPARDNLGAI